MNNLFLLMKIQVQAMLMKSSNRRNRKKTVAGIGTLILLAFVFTYISVVYVVGMVSLFPDGYKYIALYVMGFVTVFMLLVFGYQSAGGHLFGFKDYDLLMALPVKKSTVLISKFLSFLFLEYFYGFFLLAPSIIIVGIAANYGILYYVMGFLAWLLVPIVPMVIVSVLAYLSMYAAGKFKYKNLMNNIFYIILMAVVFILIFSYQRLLVAEPSQLLSMKENIELYMPFVGLLFNGMIFGDGVHFILGVGLNVLVFVLFVWLFSKNYMKLNGQIRSGYKVKNFKLKESKANSSFHALLNKELRTYFSNTVYFMNTAILPILAVGGFVYLCLFMREDILMVIDLMPGIVMPVLCGSILFMSLVSCTTNSTISLEGKNFDTLKTFPIDTFDIFKAKIALNMLIVVPAALLCSVMAVVAFNLSMADFLLCVLTTLTSSFFISAFGLVLNLHYYNLDWENSAVVVKQSLPVFITTLGGMVAGFAIVFGSVLLLEFMSPTLIVLMMNLILLLFDIGLFIYLNKGGRTQFMKIH